MNEQREPDNRRRGRGGGSFRAVAAGTPSDLSTAEAAAILDVTERTVRRAIGRGDLGAIKRGSTYRVPAAELDRYMARQTPDAPPQPVARIVNFPPPAETLITLPAAFSSFVGREEDVARVVAFLSDPQVRFLTLTGPGGIGKTRLAIAAAEAVRDEFPDGVVFVPLADTSQPELVKPAIADALAMREVAGRDRQSQLRSFLAGKRLLLVLDNFERLLEAAPAVAALVADFPQLSVLVTSRSRLWVQGERELPVPPLGLASSDATPDDLLRSGAGRLFFERAQAQDPGFTVDAASAPTIASICSRLDGLPLAIELAAARTRVLTPRQMHERLDRSLPILTAGGRNAPARHRTMREAIAWSYEALTAEQQTLFRQLAVFHGSCTLEALEWVVERVAEDGRRKAEGGRREAGSRPGEQVSRPITLSPYHPITQNLTPQRPDTLTPTSDTLDVVDSLLGQNLLTREIGSDGEPRVRLLETIREYGQERLEPGESDAFRAAHAAYYLMLARSLRPIVDTYATRAPLDRLAADDANLRAALAWLDERGPAADLCALVASLALYWLAFGYPPEAATWLERALSKRDAASPADQGVLLTHFGELLMLRSDLTRAETVFADGLALLRSLDDPFDLALILISSGATRNFGGQYSEAEPVLEEALAVATTIPDSTLRAALAGRALANLSVTARGQGKFALAVEWSEAALRWYDGHGFELAETRVLFDLASIAEDQGDHERVVDLSLRCLTRTGERGDMRLVAEALKGIASAATAWGDNRSALLLFGAVEALREHVGLARMTPADRSRLERDIATLRESVGAESESVLAEGRALPLAVAIDLAGTISRPDGGRTRPATVSPTALTHREKQVLGLLVEGKTDRQIAETLHIGPRTVSWHVRTILEKLGASTRREVRGRARDLGLI